MKNEKCLQFVKQNKNILGWLVSDLLAWSLRFKSSCEICGRLHEALEQRRDSIFAQTFCSKLKQMRTSRN